MNAINSHRRAGGHQILQLAAGLLLFTTAFAQEYEWTNTAGGNWTAIANWTNDAAPNFPDVTADFSQAAITSDTTVHLDAPETSGYLIFGNTTQANWILDNNGNPANVLTLATTLGPTPAIIVVTNEATISATLAGDQGLAIGGSGSGTLALSSGAYSGQTTISNGTLVLTAANVLSTNDLWLGGPTLSTNPVATLILTNNSQTVSNLVTAGTTIGGGSQLIGTTATAIFSISNGQTLTVQGNALFGYLNASEDFTNNVTFTGGGNFVQFNASAVANNIPMNFQVGACNLTSGKSGPRANVDMSGLASATINLGINNTPGGVFYPTGTASYVNTSAGALIVGDAMKSNAGGEICQLVLASNTTVTANMLCVGFARQQGIVETLILGAGSNVFNVNTNSLATPPGLGREGGRMFFNTPTGSLKIRAQDGVSRAVLYVAGSRNASPGNAYTNGTPGPLPGMTSAQYADFSGHYADLYLSSLVVGDERHGDGNYFLECWTNYMSFSEGILDTTGVLLGETRGEADGTNYYTCSLNLLGGTVLVGTNGITMAQIPFNEAGSIYLYTNDTYLNIGGGMVSVNGSIVAALQDNTNQFYDFSTITITNGSLSVTGNIYCAAPTTVPTTVPLEQRVATLTLNGGTLNMNGNAIGSNPSGPTVTNNYIDVLNFLSGTLESIGQLNNGATPVVMNGTGTLTLAGINSYSGGTIASNGLLIANNDGALGIGNVTVAAGATLTLTNGVSNQFINPGGNLYLNSGANPVNLGFGGTPNRVAGLFFAGVAQATGTWGSSHSPAAHPDDTHFSGTGTIVVTTPSSVTVNSSASSAVAGQAVVLTATVSGASGTPTGTVTFSTGGIALGTATLAGGTASITNSALPAGTDSIIASYSGNATYSPSVSSAFLQVITAPAIVVSGSNLMLYYYNSVVGTNYVLLTTTSLSPPIVWTPVFTNAGTGGVLIFTNPFSASTPQQFFQYQFQ